jgi:hypothetical protein
VSPYIDVKVDLAFHELVLLIGINDVFDERFVDSINYTPKCISITLLLLFFKQFYLHRHKMDLFQQVLYVLIFDIKVRIQAEDCRTVVLLGNSN